MTDSFEKQIPSYYDKFIKTTFNTQYYSVVQVVDVLWSGWEYDDTAWLIRVNGKYIAIATNHGKPSVVDEDWFFQKIDEYAKVTADSLKAIELLKSQNNSTVS